MKVILIQDVERLGSMGDAVTVKDGYARNYLIPNKKAREATPGNMKMMDDLKKKREEEEKKKIGEFQALAEKISALSLTIAAQAGEEEKLFGSVSNDMIRDALAEEGVTVDKKDIIIEEPIKKLGIYKVSVRIHPEVKASLKVWVVKK